jgi:hypothetical protein
MKSPLVCSRAGLVRPILEQGDQSLPDQETNGRARCGHAQTGVIGEIFNRDQTCLPFLRELLGDRPENSHFVAHGTGQYGTAAAPLSSALIGWKGKNSGQGDLFDDVADFPVGVLAGHTQ